MSGYKPAWNEELASEGEERRLPSDSSSSSSSSSSSEDSSDDDGPLFRFGHINAKVQDLRRKASRKEQMVATANKSVVVETPSKLALVEVNQKRLMGRNLSTTSSRKRKASRTRVLSLSEN